MLAALLGFVSLVLAYALARERAQNVRLRAERRLLRLAPGSWEAFHRIPARRARAHALPG
jgi:hypothetical protein